MNGVTIFNHSVRQVLGNLGMAVRVSWWLVAFIVASVLAVIAIVPAETITAILQARQNMQAILPIGGRDAAIMLLSGLVFLAIAFWAVSLIAIVWHRYILLEEIPRGVIPYRREYRIGRYFWSGVGIWFLTILIGALIAGFLVMIIGPAFLGAGNGGGSLPGVLGMLITGIVITVFYLRLALVLPAVALEDGMTLGMAWQASSGFSGAIAVAGVLLTLMGIVVGFILDFIAGTGVPSLLVSGLEMAYNWFYFMLNISLLSTLYGFIVQKREIY